MKKRTERKRLTLDRTQIQVLLEPRLRDVVGGDSDNKRCTNGRIGTRQCMAVE